MVILTIYTERVPRVPGRDRLTAVALGPHYDGITALTVRFGFHDEPNIPNALCLAAREGLLDGDIDIPQVTYFLSQINVAAARERTMRAWRT